jgi:hypothetical protein
MFRSLAQLRKRRRKRKHRRRIILLPLLLLRVPTMPPKARIPSTTSGPHRFNPARRRSHQYQGNSAIFPRLLDGIGTLPRRSSAHTAIICPPLQHNLHHHLRRSRQGLHTSSPRPRRPLIFDQPQKNQLLSNRPLHSTPCR